MRLPEGHSADGLRAVILETRWTPVHDDHGDVDQTVFDWYPIRPGARLMSDGTGRAAEFECHPDEWVEAIRWLICDAEVQQAIGRGASAELQMIRC